MIESEKIKEDFPRQFGRRAWLAVLQDKSPRAANLSMSQQARWA
jgi:hypothetical protein